MIPDEFYAGFCGRPDDTLKEIYRGEGKAVPSEIPQPLYGLPPELIALNESAEKYANDGLYPSAEETYQKAVDLGAKMDAEHNQYAGLRILEMDYLARLYVKEGVKDRAEKTFASALEIEEQEVREQARSQPGHAGGAAGLFPWGLVDLYQNEGRLQDAESAIRRVLEIQIGALGERHRAIVQTLVHLADIYAKEGEQEPSKLADAKATYERAIAMQEANMGPNDPSVADLLRRYADFLSASNDPAKAAQVRARITSIEAHQPKADKP
jgi:tetratricopeptide (TPR) repeat protein